MYGPTAMPPMAPPMGPPMKPKTMKPMIAGIFMIIAAIEGIAFWGLIAALGGIFAGLPFVGGLGAIIVVCGAIGIIFGLITLVGGVMALQRKKWSWALIGSILGLFMFGWTGYAEASILSLIAIILLAISRNEF